MHTKRYHNILDIERCNNTIDNSEQLQTFIHQLAKEIDMTILEGPILAKGLDENPGWSVLAIVDFSHISIHTFTKHQEALIDIFSCKAYDRKKVHDFCINFFGTPESVVRQKEVWWE